MSVPGQRPEHPIIARHPPAAHRIVSAARALHRVREIRRGDLDVSNQRAGDGAIDARPHANRAADRRDEPDENVRVGRAGVQDIAREHTDTAVRFRPRIDNDVAARGVQARVLIRWGMRRTCCDNRVGRERRIDGSVASIHRHSVVDPVTARRGSRATALPRPAGRFRTRR